MGKDVMTYERFRVQHHCAEGRCTHPFYKDFLLCRNFSLLVRTGKNPTNCLYYDNTLDYKNK